MYKTEVLCRKKGDFIMRLETKLNFRGYLEDVKDGKVFKHVNFEDENGTGAQFNCSDDIDLKVFKKNDNVRCIVDYNVQYKTLKVVEITKLNA